jgi:hypothetical protein
MADTSPDVKLYLKGSWQFYLIVVTRSPRPAYQVEELVKVERVDTFIRNIVHFEKEAPLSQFKLVNDKRPSLALFRDTIKPAWEDSHNKDGGSFGFAIPQNEETLQAVNDTWRNLQLSAVATDGLEDEGTERIVNGVIVTLKSDKSNTRFFFEVWVAKHQMDQQRKEHFMAKIRACIRLPEGMQVPEVKFQRHRMGK